MTSENLPDKAAEAGQERLSEQIARTGRVLPPVSLSRRAGDRRS